jgi:hypothetical protein
MKLLAAALALFALTAAPAQAQTAERWTAPSRVWSIDYASSGWTFANPVPPDLAHLNLIMIPLAPPPDDQIRMCAVTEMTYDEGLPRAEIAGAGARFDQARASAAFRGQTITGVTHATINGVVVADVSATTERQRHRHRVFYYPAAQGAYFIDVHCFWIEGVPAQGVAEIEAILNSIRIDAASP